MKKIFFLFLLPVLFEFSCSTTKTATTLVDQYKYDFRKRSLVKMALLFLHIRLQVKLV
jgi:hypothetical protein